ncbi:uncharacterized protein E5676_scaffold718G00170 [Cucumis melo var. makuwa]|uniref:Uncharacterized protein n=1 Tax=Cucumis melo var. makuwa TaxID=1194695 RepID=A0A5A7SLJ7_CUCMM|nr:uncharacterized protein E6C27_scaffold1204G00180 [Cucumis melo var. makuwa]TYK06459.1 uncharacterized protein E5676_scaffold718G00170 [Cucumis melo var. makuwa]
MKPFVMRLTRPRMFFDARRESNSLGILGTEITQAELSKEGLGIGNHCPCIKTLVKISVGGKMEHLYGLQKDIWELEARFQVEPILKEEIVRSRPVDPKLRKLVEEVRCDRRSDYAFRKDGALLKDKRLCVTPSPVDLLACLARRGVT